MAKRFSISITNQSGAEQKYAIFGQPPKVAGLMQGKIWSNVLDTAETPDSQNATFSISNKYYATCGHSKHRPAAGVNVNVGGSTPVQLGNVQDDGSLIPGTTLALAVQNNAPFFSPTPLPPTAARGCFEIETPATFTTAQATEHNYMIGVGGPTGGGSVRPTAAFVPQPNVRYQIEPVSTYYISYGDYKHGGLIDTRTVGPAVAVDFTRIGPHVKIVHNNRGILTIQSA